MPSSGLPTVTAARTELSGRSGFGSFIDGCLADDPVSGLANDVGRSAAPESKRPVPGQKNEADELVAPTSMAFAVASRPPLILCWFVEPAAFSHAAPIAMAPDFPAADSLAGGSASTIGAAQRTATADPFQCDLPPAGDDLATKVDATEVASPGVRALQNGTELAFSVRMISPEPPTDASGAANARRGSYDAGRGKPDVSQTPDASSESVSGSSAPPPLPSATSDCTDNTVVDDLAAAASSSVSCTADHTGSTPARSERTPSEHTVVTESAHGAPGSPSGNNQSGLKGGILSGARGDYGQPENPRATAAASPRGICPPVSATTKTGASGDPPPSDQGENPSAWPVDMAWMGNTPAASPADGEPPPPTPAQEAAKVRPAEEPPEPPVPAVSREVSLHLADDESRVDIRLAEHAGEVRVTVHTPDRDLADSLRADLPDLVGKLHQSGFQAEVWRSTDTQAVQGRRGQPGGSASQEHSPGGRKDGRQQPHAQRSKDQSRRAGEWQSSLDRAQEIQK